MTEYYKIEKNVHIPDRRDTHKLNTMGIGDSMLVPASAVNSARTMANRRWGKGSIVSRKTDDGCRLWRVK